MMQCHDRLDPAASQSFKDINVMLQFLLRKMPFLRLDAGPLNGKTMGIVPQGFGQIEILFVKIIMTAGPADVPCPQPFPTATSRN